MAPGGDRPSRHGLDCAPTRRLRWLSPAVAPFCTSRYYLLDRAMGSRTARILVILMLTTVLVAGLGVARSMLLARRRSALAESLLARLCNASPRETRTLIDQLVGLGRIGEQALAGLLTHELWHIRGYAAYALRLGRGGRTVLPLVSALKDSSWAVRGSALRALRHLACKGDAESQKAVRLFGAERLVVCLHDESVEVRARAAKLLATVPSPQVCSALGALLANDMSPTVRVWAADALGEVNDAEAVLPLCKALGDISPHVIAHALFSLRRIGDRRSSPYVVALLDDSRPSLRWLSAQALCTCGADDAVPALRRLLTDTSQEMRLLAVRALTAIGSDDAAEALTVVLADGDALARARAIRGIARCRYHKAVPSLIRCLRDGSEFVREQACFAIWKITGEGFDGTDRGPEKILEWWEEKGKYDYGKKQERQG